MPSVVGNGESYVPSVGGHGCVCLYVPSVGGHRGVCVPVSRSSWMCVCLCVPSVGGHRGVCGIFSGIS